RGGGGRSPGAGSGARRRRPGPRPPPRVNVRSTLRSAIGDLASVGRPFAVVGGLAASARAVSRFTADVACAVAVADDAEAEAVVFAMNAKGYTVKSTIEHTN